MPLTALHADAGVLDLTADTLGAGLTWEQVHRSQPRAPLTCRECGHGLHAKQSHRGWRFFAHDTGAPECALTGETIAHRLLKVELANAIRQAGWHAELEVAGDGWRADVLATSPDGQTRMAWEAQLAPSTTDELVARTATMAASEVAVCWVTDKDRPWLGHVPAVRIRPDEPGGSNADEAATTSSGAGTTDTPAAPVVIDGLGAFRPDWCQQRHRCEIHARHGYYGSDAGPCPGHGRWVRPPGELPLTTFVTHVLRGSVKAHQAAAEPLFALGRHDPGPQVWTTQPHYLAERAQLEATAAAQEWQLQHDKQQSSRRRQRDDHLTAIANLQAHQKAVQPLAVELVGREARGYVGVRDPDVQWAMGVPLFVHDQVQAVICPVAGRVTGAVRARLGELTLIVASQKERDRLVKVCVPGQRIEVLEVEVPTVSLTVPEGVSVRQAVNLMFGRRKY